MSHFGTRKRRRPDMSIRPRMRLAVGLAKTVEYIEKMFAAS
jgi:hypothetical protein